jgi:hypothetical protein
MKNLYTKSEFLNLNKYENLNEGIFQFIGKMFNKAKSYINKIKGGKEVDKIFNDHLKLIDEEIKKKIGVSLNLSAEEQLVKKESMNLITEQDNAPTVDDNTEDGNNNSNAQSNGDSNAQSSDDSNLKLTAKTLREKQKLIEEIINNHKNTALRLMDQVLQKMGGAENNPKLKVIIDNKKDEFRLKFLNAQIAALDKGGDKVSANKLASERNNLAKSLEARWNLDNVQYAEVEVDGNKFKIGVPYRYKTEGGIKTIKISKKSELPGKVFAAYVSDKFGLTTPQNFDASNIDLGTDPKVGFIPENGKEYRYFSTNNNKIIKVKVINPNVNGMTEVQVGDNKFKVNPGALIDIKNKD